MYKIEAIIRTHRLDAVRDALHAIDLIGLTASDCRGEGRQRSTAHSFRGSQYSHNLEPRLRVEVVVTEAQLAGALDAIQAAATTGEVGDGKIFVSALHQVVRIRTNERGESALL
jgi:nitrogen regulatory protein P-II 1